MMKKVFLLFSVCLVMAYASSAFAAVTLKRLGDHPLYRPPLTSETDLRTMIEKRSSALKVGFTKAGNPEMFEKFMSQIPTAKIETITVAPGERFDWMMFRKNGTGPVTVAKDVTWGGAAGFDAFRFYIDTDKERYEFIVPATCGNLSLKSITAIPAAAVVAANQDPVCRMKLSSGELKCGQVVTVDASESTDSDGAIAKVVFKLLDSANQVVAEKSDTEAPFMQEFSIPCDSPSYTITTVVIDTAGAQSNPADCTQTVAVAENRKGGPVVDVGFAHQFDPANYAFARGGYEYFVAENLSILGMVGGFAHFDGDDGESSFTADALLNYYLNDKMFVGGGIGFWSGDDGNADLIVNMGYLIHEKPDVMKTSLFIEGRCETDELISSYASRLGIGLRFQF